MSAYDYGNRTVPYASGITGITTPNGSDAKSPHQGPVTPKGRVGMMRDPQEISTSRCSLQRCRSGRLHLEDWKPLPKS